MSANLKATLTLILQTVLYKSRDFLKSYGEVPSQALLYVNSKFVCEFSTHSSHRLSKKDLILLQLLVECKCMPSTASRSFPPSPSKGSTCHSDSNEEETSYFGDTESECEDDSQKRRRTSSLAEVPLLHSFAKGVSGGDVFNALTFLLFLEVSKDVADLRLPFCVRVIQVTTAVVAVLICELSSRFQAKSIHSVINTLTKASSGRKERGVCDLQEFDKSSLHLKKILERNPSRSAKQLKDRLNKLIQCDIRKYCCGFVKNDLPVQVDALSSAICSSLRTFYQETVYDFEQNRLSRVTALEQVRWHVISMQSFCHEQTHLYLEYLEVKSKINMTIEPYTSVIPGLKAFVYVDRKINSLVFAAAIRKK